MRIALCTHDSMKLLLTFFVFSSPNLYALFFKKFQFFCWLYMVLYDHRKSESYKGKKKTIVFFFWDWYNSVKIITFNWVQFFANGITWFRICIFEIYSAYKNFTYPVLCWTPDWFYCLATMSSAAINTDV